MVGDLCPALTLVIDATLSQSTPTLYQPFNGSVARLISIGVCNIGCAAC